ncbi:helix-turn-helix domain-containing protein [Kitasatospora sp. NPDC004615]|uniref:helix-turn-helix domain-containing protein n=1 Tax=Kitasatospora sp. NPDC004615 TaxID=3364017 RepID=UPI0036B3A2D1
MTTLYDRIASTEDGRRRLAVSRLKREALRAIHIALQESGITQAELARRIGIRKSAVSQVLNGDGNIQIRTLAEYLFALGYEMDLRVVEEGEPRKAMTEQRDALPAFPRAQEAAPERPHALTSYAVVPTAEPGAHMLVDMTAWQEVGESSTVRFEGSAHLVPHAARTTSIDASVEFKPLVSRNNA